MVSASLRLDKGPIWTWRSLSCGSVRMVTSYPRCLRAVSRLSASSRWETAAI